MSKHQVMMPMPLLLEMCRSGVFKLVLKKRMMIRLISSGRGMRDTMYFLEIYLLSWALKVLLKFFTIRDLLDIGCMVLVIILVYMSWFFV
jgi:hypothetical protein